MSSLGRRGRRGHLLGRAVLRRSAAARGLLFGYAALTDERFARRAPAGRALLSAQVVSQIRDQRVSCRVTSMVSVSILIREERRTLPWP